MTKAKGFLSPWDFLLQSLAGNSFGHTSHPSLGLLPFDTKLKGKGPFCLVQEGLGSHRGERS